MKYWKDGSFVFSGILNGLQGKERNFTGSLTNHYVNYGILLIILNDAYYLNIGLHMNFQPHKYVEHPQ